MGSSQDEKVSIKTPDIDYRIEGLICNDNENNT